MVAALLGALAPTISRATARENAGHLLVAICSAGGTHWVALDRATVDGEAGNVGGEWTLALDRCPYCFAPAGAVPLPPTDSALPLLAPGHVPPLVVVDLAPRPRTTWPPSSPRAPPDRR